MRMICTTFFFYSKTLLILVLYKEHVIWKKLSDTVGWGVENHPNLSDAFSSDKAYYY